MSCGFCLPACPTYAMTGDEASSPRGRINLMRALQTGELTMADGAVQEQASFCLGCRACEVVCPAGVQYGELLEEWRDAQWSGRRKPLLARILTFAVARRWRVRMLGLGRRHAQTATGAGPHLMLGCFERALYPSVSRAACEVAPELDAVAAQGCCGALHAHNGELAKGRAMAAELAQQLPGLIVTTSGGCAAHLVAVLGRGRVQEISEYLDSSRGVRRRPLGRRGPRVTLQDSCHLRNGLDVWREPRSLLQEIAELVELPEAAACCGAAGSYALLRPKDSRRVLAAKLDAIEAARVDYVIVVNPGCYRQLAMGLRRRRSNVRVLHIVEFLADGRRNWPGWQSSRDQPSHC